MLYIKFYKINKKHWRDTCTLIIEGALNLLFFFASINYQYKKIIKII